MMSKKEYCQKAKNTAPRSPILRNCLCAFLSGGTLCAVGQVAATLLLQAGLPQQQARALASICLIALSAVLTALHWYDGIAKHAGAGTLVPITGFANAIASASIEFKSEGFVLGVGAKMFAIAGPVILYGVIYWITTLF